MIEHRLIERVIEVMNKELRRLENDKPLNTALIDVVVDFIRTYADRCHHGKEEDILFRDLKKKPLSEEHEKILNELVREHQWGRKTTGTLVDANTKYAGGDDEALNTVIDCLKTLVEFYPNHIEKEDKHFFMPVMDYFSQEEKDAMLQEEYEFDRTLIHEKYEDIVVRMEDQV
jgi:hemerythrin-like domain-containing protein